MHHRNMAFQFSGRWFLGLNGFSVFRADRSNGNDPHGGVLVAIRTFLNPIAYAHNTENEVLFVEIDVNGNKLKIVTVYRSTSMTSYQNQTFVDFLRGKLQFESRFILVGDLNYPRIDWQNLVSDCPRERLFLDFVNENCLHQHVSEPTRGGNILDLICCTEPDLVSQVFVGEQFSTSDHSYVTCKLNIFRPKRDKRAFPNFYRADWETIRLYLSCIDWDQIFLNCEVNSMYEIFVLKIRHAVDNFIPLSVPIDKTARWENSTIKRMVAKKRRKWSLYQRNPSRRQKRQYNRYAKYVKRQVHFIKSDYEKKLFRNRNSSQKSFYSYVDRVTGSKKQTDIHQLKVGGVTFSSSYQKALALSDQYRSVYTIENDLIPPSEQKMPPDSFSDLQITETDIFEAIRKMNAGGAPGPDCIYPKFIKEMSCFLIKPIMSIFRKSLQTGQVPKLWRSGIIVPIYKNNRKPEDPSSYRPVCLTSVVCKLFERIIHKYLIIYLRVNEIISSSQHAFLTGKSTATNLIDCLNDWTKLIDARKPVDILYLDLAKAFDSVSHEKMLHKLIKIGIGSNVLQWIKSFLTEREHCVRVGSSLSPYETVISGIPQGTIIGPTLFILYINDVAELNLSSSLKLYADDVKIYREVSSADEADQLQSDLESVAVFFTDWQLTLNIDKCETIHLGSNNMQRLYEWNNSQIPTQNSCRDLGIKISDNSKFSDHCNQVVQRAYYRLRQFRLSFSCKEVDFKVHMYSTFIRPLLEYNTVVWSPYLLRDIDKVEKVQRFFTRLLPGLGEMSYSDRLRVLNLQSLEMRRIINDLIFVYKLLNELVDFDYRALFEMNTNNTRGHSLKLNHQYSRCNFRKTFFANRVIPIWNSLPAAVVESESLARFKNELKCIDLSRFCRGRALMT